MKIKTYTYYLILFLAIFGVSYLGIIEFSELKALLVGEKEYSYIPNYSKNNIYEINLIYIGSSTCRYSNTDELYRAVDIIKSLIRDKTKKYNLGFSAIGISVDWVPARGIDHLNNFGLFDEVIAGNNWNNNGIMKYVGDKGEEASTPQIVLTFRTYTELIQTNIVEEKRILAIRGEKQILNWLKQRTPLPTNFIQEIKQL